LFSSAAKKAGCLLVIANAGFTTDWQRAAIRQDADWFRRLNGGGG
jgi:hypothetical protein